MTKPKRDLKSKHIMIRLTPAQHRALAKAAKAAGSDGLATWARATLVACAQDGAVSTRTGEVLS